MKRLEFFRKILSVPIVAPIMAALGIFFISKPTPSRCIGIYGAEDDMIMAENARMLAVRDLAPLGEPLEDRCEIIERNGKLWNYRFDNGSMIRSIYINWDKLFNTI